MPVRRFDLDREFLCHWDFVAVSNLDVSRGSFRDDARGFQLVSHSGAYDRDVAAGVKEYGNFDRVTHGLKSNGDSWAVCRFCRVVAHLVGHRRFPVGTIWLDVPRLTTVVACHWSAWLLRFRFDLGTVERFLMASFVSSELSVTFARAKYKNSK